MNIGLIINPVAGVGGPAGLRGSDGAEIQALAIEKGSTFQSNEKVKRALKELKVPKEDLLFYTGPGQMGADVLKALDFNVNVIGQEKKLTTGADTESLARMMSQHVDLLVFAGGDGTARNIYNAVGLSLPCIGIPTGVKIHSAVYGNSPKDAVLSLTRYIENYQVARIVEREVMDIDEEQFRQNIVQATLHGYLSVPYAKNLMQQSKSSTKFSEADVTGIADELSDRMALEDQNTCYLFGTGGTTFKTMEKLGYAGSLLGVDVVSNRELVIKDGSEQEIFDYVKGKKIVIVVTVIGGQGHIFGRGNQQISPRIISCCQPGKLWIVANAEKIYSLPGHILRVDTSDHMLDQALSGYWKVIVGWQEQIICPIKG